MRLDWVKSDRMSFIENRLRAYGRSTLERPNESKIKDTVVNAKRAFYEGAVQREVFFMEFIYEQTAYIQKRWWILQFLLLLFVGCFLHETEDSGLIQRLMGISASLFVIMAVPELCKNRSSNAMEIEGAAYFSLRQIYAARMLVFAAVDSAFLGSFTGILSLTGMVSMEEIVIQFFLPMLVTCCICLRTLCSRYLASEYAACALSLLWTAVWSLLILNDNVYRRVSLPIWGSGFVLAAGYLTYVVRRVLRECEGLDAIR